MSESTSDAPQDDWRRTSRGWERSRRWAAQAVPHALPALHPALVGVLCLFTSLAALVAFPVPTRYGNS